MIKNQFETVELSLDSYEEKDGNFYFTAKSLTNDFECDAVLERLAKDSINKHLIWKHKHPIQDENNESHIYGTVVDSKVVEGSLKTTYHVYDHTEDHKKFIELVKEKQTIGDPLGISMRYRKYFHEDKINHADVFEHSGTPMPKCEDCLIDDYIGEKKMANKDKDKPDAPEAKDKELENQELDKHLEKIAELEKVLNSRTETLEGYKTKIETLEKEVKEAKDSKATETMTLEDRVGELEKTIKANKKEYKNEIELLNKKPILDEMFELKPELDDMEKALYSGQTKKYLEAKREVWKEEANTKPFVKTMEDTANEAQEKGKDQDKKKDDVKDELNEADIMKFTQMLSKRHRDMMLKQFNENKKNKSD